MATKKKQPEAEPQAKSIKIPGLRRMKLLATITGVTPLIVNRFSQRKVEEIERAQSGAAKITKEPRNPEREFQEARYHFGGKDYVTGVAPKRAMIAAGQRFADEKGTELMGAISIPLEYLEVINPEPTTKEWPVMRTDIGRVGPSRTASPVYRPEYWPWKIVVPIIFNADFISLNQVVNLLSLAGFSVGLGEWRVDKKGIFGQWKVTDVTVEEMEQI